MLNFLNSAVLIAAAAALIPLLIHLFSRRRVKVVPFSSLKHLKEMQKRQVRRIKIRQLLLLILRMLIILVAVLAFGRPATKGGYIGSHAGVSSVILLDRSASMQRQLKDGQLFDLARNKVSDILGSFGQSDEVALIPFDRQTYFPSGERFFSSDMAGQILDDITPGYDMADIEKAYQKGLELLDNASNLNKEMYLITDRQLNSLPEKPDTVQGEVTSYLVDLPIEVDGNCGITSIEMGGQLIEVGSEFKLKADVQNYDAREKTELLASLFIDGIRVMQKEFKIESGGRESITLEHTIQKTGFHTGWVEIADDDFTADNKYFFSFRIPEQFNVLIIDGDGGGDIIRLALVPSQEIARYWSVKMTDPENLTSIRFGDYDLIIISGADSLGKAETSRLFEFVDAGGGMLFVLGEKTDQDYFNQQLAQKLNAKIVAPMPLSFSGAGYYTMERFDYNHPIFAPFSELHADELPSFRYFALPRIAAYSSANNLAYFSNDMPALIESGYGLGRILFLAAPILPRFTDLASHSFFVPFIIRASEYLAQDISSYEKHHYIGQNIIRTVSDKLSSENLVDFITPDNTVYQIAGIQKTGQVAYDCRPTDLPGIYQLMSGNRLLDVFPVNLSPDEGNLQAVDLSRLAASLGLDNYKTIPFKTGSEQIISESRFGRELWKVFLWAVVVLLVVEMIFSREKAIPVDES